MSTVLQIFPRCRINVSCYLDDLQSFVEIKNYLYTITLHPTFPLMSSAVQYQHYLYILQMYITSLIVASYGIYLFIRHFTSVDMYTLNSVVKRKYA